MVVIVMVVVQWSCNDLEPVTVALGNCLGYSLLPVRRGRMSLGMQRFGVGAGEL